MRVVDLLLELVFPTRCVSCRASGDWWCASCRGQVERLRKNLCARCGGVKIEHECPNTLSGCDAIFVTGYYHDPRLRAAIHALKYKGATRILPSLAAFLESWRDERIDPWPWAGSSSLAVQAVPATPYRVRERGFDQADLLADLVARTIVPWGSRIHALERRDQSMTQASLEHGPLRRVNVSGMFSMVPGVSVPSSVLLVDDVLTTGSTLEEAAHLLRRAGVERVYGFSLAVGA